MGVPPMLAAQSFKKELDIEGSASSQVAYTGGTPVPQ
jgi:hypothetical protein